MFSNKSCDLNEICTSYHMSIVLYIQFEIHVLKRLYLRDMDLCCRPPIPNLIDIYLVASDMKCADGLYMLLFCIHFVHRSPKVCCNCRLL
jgi:hypothetical protein